MTSQWGSHGNLTHSSHGDGSQVSMDSHTAHSDTHGNHKSIHGNQDSNHITMRRGHMTPLITNHYGLTQAAYDERYGWQQPKQQTCRGKLRHLKAQCMCTGACCGSCLASKLPVIGTVRSYQWREYLAGDVLAGLSVGVLQVPQSLGYALLASLPPIIGLYMSFFPPIIYGLLGASEYISMGTMAISSLIVATAITKGLSGADGGSLVVSGNLTLPSLDNLTNTTGIVTTALDDERISIAISVSFMSGVFLLLICACRLDFWTCYVSDPFISGYLTATNIVVLTHQVRHMLGVTVGKHSGPLAYFKLLRDIFTDIPNTNIATLVTSVVSCTLLIVVKKCINERYKAKLRVPVPIDLIVVILGTVISHWCEFEARFGVRIIEDIPSGLPRPSVPSPGYMWTYIVDAFVLALVSYIMVLMMARIFAQRHNTTCDARQELLATGACAAVGAFFSCLTASTSPPRCFLGEMAGGRTRLVHLVSAMLVLLTLFFLAPLLESLPLCILASLILVSCIPLFEHYKKCVFYWRTSSYDLSIWLVTSLATLFLGIDIGLFVGIGFSSLVVVYRTQRPYITTLTLARDDGLLLDSRRYDSAKIRPLPGVCIYHCEAPLYFATLDLFRDGLYSACVNPMAAQQPLPDTPSQQVNPSKHQSPDTADPAIAVDGGDRVVAVEMTDITHHHGDGAMEKQPLTSCHGHRSMLPGCHGDSAAETTPMTGVAETAAVVSAPARWHTVIIDLSAVGFVDTAGAVLLAGLSDEYRRAGVTFVVAGANATVRGQLARVPACRGLVRDALYPHVQDAIIRHGYSITGKHTD